MQEVRARVGKISQSYLNEVDNKNPYSTHEYVDIGNRLVRALVFMNTKLKKLAERCAYLPVEGETLCFDLKNLYSNQAAGNTRFCWYLNVLEFVAGDGTKFKYCGLVDIDMKPEQQLVDIYREVIAEVEYQRIYKKRACYAWFTGKKGFRIGFLPGFDSIKREASEYFLYPIGGTAKPKKPELSSVLLNGMIDDSIYVTGHGVKFDLMHHPDTKRLPVFLTGDAEADLAKILGFYPTNTNELCSIGNFWVELFTELEMILKTPSDTMLLPEGGRIETITRSLAPRSRDVIDDTVVDPLVHVVPIIDRGETRRIAREFIGSVLGSDPLQVLLVKFTEETKCRKTDIPVRIKVISDSILVITFRLHKDDLVCPLHNKKHKASGKIYVVYSRNALHFSIRCHSNTASTKEVRVPLFAQKQLITGFIPQTLEEISPYTTTITAPFIGDMLVKDPRFYHKDVILLRSAMGSGKTVAISSLIKDMGEKIGESLRVLVISTRRTCMMMLAELFDVAKYLNSSNGIVRDDIHQMDKVVVSMESLHKLIPHGSVNIVKKFDLVVLDECESILANFSSVTMKNKRKNYQLLKAIIETEGTKTVFSDAFLGECTVHFLMTSGLARSKSWSLIVNTHNKTTTKYELFTAGSSNSYIWEYKTAVTTGQRFIFASDRIDCITYFQDLLVTFLEPEDLKKKKVLTITAGSPPDVIASASDCKSWEEYDYIFYSPAVTVGNSYAPEDPEKRFHLVFGVFTGTCTTLDAIQMTGRARSLKRQVAKILLTQTDVTNGKEFVGSREEISKYIEERITTASDELGELLRADRNKALARMMSEQIPGSQLITDLSSSADSILIVPKEVEIESVKIEMPIPYLETIFTINVVNERKSKFLQLDHWALYLSTTFLSFVVVKERQQQKKAPAPIMSIILSKKKQYEERRRLANDEYSSDVILSQEELKKKKEEDSVMSEVTTNQVNIRKIQSLLGKHMSPELARVIEKIQTGNIRDIKDLPINWDKLHAFIAAHVHVDCLERFYYFFRNIERPIEAIKNTELLGTQIKNTSEFLGRGSMILGHVKPLYDALMKDMINAAAHLRNKTSWVGIPEWIAMDKDMEFVYLDITAWFCMNTVDAYKLLCDFLNKKDAIQEESVYYRTQPLKADANKNLKLAMEKVFSKFPEVDFAAGIGEFQKLNIPSKTCSLLSVSISGILLILTKYFQNLFGALFQKVTWEEQKRLGFLDSRRRYQNIRSSRVRFRDDLYENSKSLSLLVFEDKMEFFPDYPYFDMIVQ